MYRQKLRSKKLLVNILTLVVLTKIVNSRNVPNIPPPTLDTQVSKLNISENSRDKEFLKEDASAIIEQFSNLFTNPVKTKTPGSSYHLAPQVNKFDNGAYGSKIVLGIVENVKETKTPKPVEDQEKSQTIVKYFDQEDYNGLKINPIVVADIFDDAENHQQKRVRNRKEIIDLEQLESPIKPDSDANEKRENKEYHTDDHDNKTREGDANEDKENESLKTNEENESNEENEGKESSKEGEENGNIKEDVEDESIKEDVEDEVVKEDVENESIKSDDEDEAVKEYEEHESNKQDEDSQGIKGDDENENIKEDEEYKGKPIYNESPKDNDEYKVNPTYAEINGQLSNAEGLPHEDDRYESDEKIDESLTDSDIPRGNNNKKLKVENYWNPYKETSEEKEEINDHNKDNTDIAVQEPLPKYEEDEDTQSEQQSESDGDQKVNSELNDKASISKEEDTHSNQEKNAENTHEDAKKKKKGGKHSSGKGDEHHSHVHAKKGEKGLKAYKGYHEETKASKGHNDKEHHGKKYADEKGSKGKHHEDRGHHGEHIKGEKGEKASDFSEEGKHTKGHSTKGEHNIHKKDEYNKKEVFYDEHHEGGENDKHGVFEFDDHFEKGGFKKGSHHKKGDHEDHFGKKSSHAKGKHYDEKKGHKKAGGHDVHHNHHSKYGKKKSKSGKKHWAYEKGTGDQGGKKKYSADPHSTPQHISRDSSVHNNKEEGNTSEYINHPIDDHTHDKLEDVPTKENSEVSEEGEEREIVVDDDKAEPSEIELKKKEIPFNSNYNPYDTARESNTPKRKEEYNWDTIEKFDADKEAASSNQKTEKLANASEKPKIYVIIPENFEEEIPTNTKYSEIEASPSKNNLKYSTISELKKAESFPEEHRKKLSEIEHVVHMVGENVKNERKSPIYNTIGKLPVNKPRQFSVAESLP